MWKKNRTPGWFNKRFTPSGPKTYVHTLAHRCYTHSGQPLIRARRDSVSCWMTGGGGEEAAEVPYVRKSCSLHHKDHMLASESQRGGRARRGRTERKDYRRAEGGRVCMWISVSFMCQHEKRRDKWIIVHTSTKHTASKNVGTCARARRHTLLSSCAFRPSPFVGFCLSNMYGWVWECEFVDLFTCL